MADEEKLKIGKKGVLAKRAAIEKTSREVQKAGKDIHKEGVQRMTAGVKQMTAAIKETNKKIEEAVTTIETGIGELQSAIQAQVKENEEAVAKIGDGTKHILNNATKFQGEMKRLGNEFKRYRKENFSAGIRDFWYG